MHINIDFLPTINLWIEERSAVFVSVMSWHIPELDKKIPFSIPINATRRASRVSISYMLDRTKKKNFLTNLIHQIQLKLATTLTNKQTVVSNLRHTFTPTVQPIVWEGWETAEPLTTRWTREVFPTPRKSRGKEMRQYNTLTVWPYKLYTEEQSSSRSWIMLV